MLAPEQLRDLVDLRVRRPAEVLQTLQARRGHDWSESPDNLFIVAADHTARGVLGVNGAAHAMADRLDLLDRLVTALAEPGVDGVLATPDVIEDLALLGALDGKIVFGSMNRGGLAGASWELDDRFTAYDAAGIEAANLEGGKMLLRLDYADQGTTRTLEACGRAVTDLSMRRRIALLEPLPSTHDAEGLVQTSRSPDDLIRAIAIGTALGNTSGYLWLKLPVVEDMDRVMATTTLPTLLLGGEPTEDVFALWKRSFAIPQVRGLAAGRAILYAKEGVVSAVRRAADIVHG